MLEGTLIEISLAKVGIADITLLHLDAKVLTGRQLAALQVVAL